MKFRPHPDLPGPQDELTLAIEALLKWYDAFPEAVLLESNHSTRLIKKAVGNGLPTMVLKTWMELIQAPPGWQYQEIQYEFEGVTYLHGEGFSQSSWRSAFNKIKTSVVMGHLHSQAGIAYSESRKSRKFSLNSGCLIDSTAKAFDYARFSHERAVLGCSVIIDGEEALFIPMPEKMASDL